MEGAARLSITQVIGGLMAGMAIYVVATGKEGWTATGKMAANGFGEHSPGGPLTVGSGGRRGGPDRRLPVGHPRLHR
jgi:hypothetical protein